MRVSLFLAGVFLSGFCVAGDCHYTRVIAIQGQSSAVLAQLAHETGTVWKRIGTQGSADTTSYQSLLQHALATDMQVMLRFSDDQVCTAGDYSTNPIALRIYK